PAVEEPDVIHVIDMDAGDLLHTPSVRERLRPERVDAVLRCAAAIDRLPCDHLRMARDGVGHRGYRAQNNEGGTNPGVRHRDPPASSPSLPPFQVIAGARNLTKLPLRPQLV